jgi:hypothetical protein
VVFLSLSRYLKSFRYRVHHFQFYRTVVLRRVTYGLLEAANRMNNSSHASVPSTVNGNECVVVAGCLLLHYKSEHNTVDSLLTMLLVSPYSSTRVSETVLRN